MQTGRLAVYVLLMIALSTGCGGGSSESACPTESGPEPAAALCIVTTDAGCTHEGDDSPTGPDFLVETVNQGSAFAYHGLSRIPERYADVERERVDTGATFVGSPPAYYTELRHGGIAPGSGTILFEDATRGTYVLWCAEEQPPSEITVAAVLDVR